MSYQEHDTIEVDAKSLAAAIAFCVDAAATDDREHMAGVHIRKWENRTTVTATDGHRVHCARFLNNTGYNQPRDFFGTGETFLTSRDAKRLQKEVTAFYKDRPKLSVRIESKTDPEGLMASFIDEPNGEWLAMITADKMNSKFPPVQHAIRPETHGGERPTLNAAYVESVTKCYRVASSLLGGTPSGLQISPGEKPDDPVRFMARVRENADTKKDQVGMRELDFLAVVMPFASGIGPDDWDTVAADIVSELRA